MSTAPTITAVLCTRNRAALAEGCLRSLLHQSLDPSRYEILVVDNGSSDNTREALRPYLDRQRVRYILEPAGGLSRARNTGWRNARGAYVGYIDDDATAGPRWLEAALGCFEDVRPRPAWVGGPIELRWEVPAPEWLLDDALAVSLGRVWWGDAPRWLGDEERLGGGNSFVTRQWLENMGGFDERLGRQAGTLLSGEEDHLRIRLMAVGGRLYYHPHVRVWHRVPEERAKPSWFYRRSYWAGVSYHIGKQTLLGEHLDHSDGDTSRRGFRGKRVFRSVKRGWRALGLFSSKSDTIDGRIYVSYVLGRAMARAHLVRKKTC